MQLLSVPQYAKLKGISQQAVYGRIRRGTLKTVTEKVEQVRVVVDDTEMQDVNPM